MAASSHPDAACRLGDPGVSVAVIIAVGVNTDGRREVLGMTIGASAAETFWTEFLRQLARRGLPFAASWLRRLRRSDRRPPGRRWRQAGDLRRPRRLEAAVSKIFTATWQRCRVHFMRNVLAHAGKSGRRVVSAFIATGVPMAARCHGVAPAFAQNDAAAASQPSAVS